LHLPTPVIVLASPLDRPEGIAHRLNKPVLPSDLLSGVLQALGTAPTHIPSQSTLQTPSNSVASLSVLLAEDNPINQKVARRLLEKRGHRVTVAANGQEAIEAWEHGRFDVILMDIQMPGLD